MKVRVKATGDIIEIDEDCSYVYAKNYDKSYALVNLEFLDVKENGNPDYWTRLEHQYAGMAMQGILAHEGTEFRNYLPQEAMDIAHALVEKMKEGNNG